MYQIERDRVREREIDRESERERSRECIRERERSTIQQAAMRSGGRAAERRHMASPADAPAGAARGLAAWGVWLLGVGNRIRV